MNSGLIEAFRRDGFVVVPDLLSPQELDRFGASVDAAVARRTEAGLRPLSERSRYEQSFLQVVNLWEDFPDVRELTFHPRVTRTAARLLGVECLRLWHDQALYKEPGGRETDPHQDQPYWPITETRTITAWIPFGPIDDEIGPMGYLPGSHRRGLRKFVNIFFGEAPDLLADPKLEGLEPVFPKVPGGAIAFHHGLTVHLAKPNRSRRMRRVHTAIFFADGSTRSARGAHPSVDRTEVRVGVPIRSDATPVAWPLEPGNLPPPPSSRVPDDAIGRHLWPDLGGGSS